MRMFANTCRHRGHELLPEGETSQRQSITCPYHAWTYDLAGSLVSARGFRDDPAFEAAEHGLVELPVKIWEGWVFGHALHQLGSDRVPSFADHLGDLARWSRRTPAGRWCSPTGTATRSRRTGR